MPGGSVGLVMSDVAGKGLKAASMVGRLRSALRAYALEGHDAGRVVEQLNRLVWTDGMDGQMATLLFVIVDPNTSRMHWVNAGHPAPLLIAGDGASEFLEGGGSVPLGVLPFPTYEQTSAPMHPGSTVVLYTDGLIERPGENLDDGMERLAVRGSRRGRGSGTALRSPAEDVAARRRRHRRRGDPRAAQPAGHRPLHGELRVRARGARPDAVAAAALAAPLRSKRAASSPRSSPPAGRRPPMRSSMPAESARHRSRSPGESMAGRSRSWCHDRGAWRQPREGDHGRGLSLMETLMDTVDVGPSDEGTTVRMTRKLESNGGIR